MRVISNSFDPSIFLLGEKIRSIDQYIEKTAIDVE